MRSPLKMLLIIVSLSVCLSATACIAETSEEPVGEVSSAILIPISIGNASGALTSPSNAADGNTSTSWNSGGPPTQWIDIDLGYDRLASRIRLLTEQSPAGWTTHNVYGRTNAGTWLQYGTLSGYTTNGQWLQLDTENTTTNIAQTPVRYLIIQTTQSPSWVAWREFEVTDGGALHHSCTTIPPGPGWVVVGRRYEPSQCSEYQDRMLYTHRYLGDQPSGVIAHVCIFANMPAGWTLIKQEVNSSFCWSQGWNVTNAFWFQKN